MAIVVVYSTSGITSSKKVCRELKLAAILKILKYWTQLQFDLRYEKNIPNYAKKNFHGDDIIDDVTGWPQSFPLYSCLGEVGSGSKLQGQCLVNKCKYRNRLSRLYMPKDGSRWITLFKIAGQRSTSQAYWVILALKWNLAALLDGSSIGNVNLAAEYQAT